MVVTATDCYAILGVTSTATDDEVRKAFRKKALQYHPDKNSSAGAEEIFKDINKAYETLSDAEKRRVYDLQRQQQQSSKSTSTSSQSRPSERSFHPTGQSHFSFDSSHPSSRFRTEDPFRHFHQRHARFASAFRSPHFHSFFERHFGSADDENEMDFDPFPSRFRSSHEQFHQKSRAKWDQSWPFDDNPFMMFEMLTRAVFDQFLNDDIFWHRPNSRLRSSSQQSNANGNVPPRSSSTNRTNIPVNHVNPKHRRPSMSRFNSKDSDEENADEHFVYEQNKPTSTRFHRRPMFKENSHENSCQFCLLPFISKETQLKHEAICRHRPTQQEKFFTSKCSYCHQYIRLSDYVNHEELCQKFGMKSTENKYSSQSNVNTDNYSSTSGNFSNDLKQLRTCHRCDRTFSALSDLFNHICEDSSKMPRQESMKRTSSAKTSPTDLRIPLFKRPLYQANINAFNDKQRYSSTDYLRPSSSPIDVLS